VEAAQRPSQFGAGLRSEIERRHVHVREGVTDELAGAEHELEELRAEVGQLRSEAVELAGRLVDEAAAHVAAQQEVGRLEASLVGQPVREPRESAEHVVVLPSSAGYALAVMPGSPPAVGTQAEVDGRQLTVSRIGRSPFPGDSRPCAFFEAN
jgi:hypothetical protein